jgi:hypothetical protein
MLHILETHCHNATRAFPRGPLQGYTICFNFVRVYFPQPVVYSAFMPCLNVFYIIVLHAAGMCLNL